MKALFDFNGIQEGDLSFKQGDKLLVTVEYVFQCFYQWFVLSNITVYL